MAEIINKEITMELQDEIVKLQLCINLTECVKEAEQEMYEDKEKHYLTMTDGDKKSQMVLFVCKLAYFKIEQ